MNDFKKRKIRRHSMAPKVIGQTKQHLATALGILLLIFGVYYAGTHILQVIGGSRLFGFLAGIAGQELETDEKGRTNILFLGVGGEGHEGKDLTDSILIASINQQGKSVSMISVPRDLYVESSLDGSRINRLYELGKAKWNSFESLDFVSTTLSHLLDLPIQYWVKIDFTAFEQVVDAIGGVELYVEHEIDDPEYPKDGTYEVERFSLPAGLQYLDGKTALKYVRSRKTSSDFDRSKRQQELLLALKEKAARENRFTSGSFIRKLYSSLEEHVETNMNVREILTLAELGSQWDSKNLVTATLNDEPIFRGGFLYTPLRELYGGAYVLLPAGENYDSLRMFVDLTLAGPRNIRDFPLAVLNGTKTPGFASKTKSILHRFGFAFADIGNARTQDLEATTWYVKDPAARPTVDFLIRLIPGSVSENLPPEYAANPDLTDAKIILELGASASSNIDILDIFKNVVELVPSSAHPGIAAGSSTQTAPQ